MTANAPLAHQHASATCPLTRTRAQLTAASDPRREGIRQYNRDVR